MPVELDSPTLGVGTDWNSFYATEPLQPNDPYSPSSFGMLLFSEPDADSALALLGGVKSPLVWGQIQGDISNQLDLAAALGTGIIPDGVKLYDNSHVLALDAGTRLLSGNWTTTQISSPNGSTYFNNSGFFGDGTNLFYSDQIQSRTSLGLVTDIDLIGGNVLTIGAIHHDSFDADRTFTFNGTTTNGDLPTILYAYVTSPVTLTFPSSYRIGAASNPATSLDLPLGYHELKWISVGGIYWLVDDLDAGGGSANWGSITGTITDQTDLVAYVAANGGGVVDGQILYDDSHIVSLDAGERYVKDAAGTIHIDWSDPSFTAYHRPIYIYGPSTGTLTDPEDYSLILRPRDIGLHYYVDGSEFVVLGLTSGLSLYGNGNDGINFINPKMVTWGVTLGTFPEYTARVRFFADRTNQPYFYSRDDTHAELYIDDIRNYSDDESLNIDLLNRKLYAHDGTTVILDYSTDLATSRASLGLVIGTNVQTWDADLDALAALSGTNNIYYRSAANTWTSVTIGSNLTFSGGTLSATAPGTGTVTSVGLSTDRSWLTVGSSPVTTSGTITLNGTTGLTANQVLATPNGSTGTVGLRSLVAADIPAIAESGVTNLVSDLALKAPLASPALTGTPTAPTQSQGNNSTAISTTAYTDLAVSNAIAGVNPAVAVAAATTAASDTSSFTYSNGVGGIGATLTGPTANVAVTIDGFTFTAVGQRLLVKNDTQSPSGAFNGVYFLSTLQITAVKPVFTRALDYNQGSDINNTGAIPVVNGTANIDTSWLLTSSVTTVGTDPLTYVQFSINPTTIVTTSRTLTIAGTAFDLSANRSWTLDTISGVSSNGFLKRTGANTWTNDSSTYLTANQTITLSGDVTGSGTTSITAALANIPSNTPLGGYLVVSNISTPTTPSSTITKVWTDFSNKRFHDINDAGIIGTTVVADTGASNNFLTAISAAGVISKAQPSFSNLTGSVAASQMPALTGDVTTSAGAVATTLANIPTAVPMAGYLGATAIAAPGTPAAGIGRIYVDSTSKNLSVKDDAGVIKHGVQTKTSVTSNFLTAISDAGLVSAAQPADSDISFTDITTGNATTSQHGFLQKLPGGTTNFLRADGTFAAPSGTGAVASDVIWDAKGDLAVGTGADTASKLTVGANDTMLMADSAQTTGIKWATPSTVRTVLALIANTTDVLAGNGTGSTTSAGFAPSNVGLLDTANAFTANNSFSKALTFSGTISPTALSGNVNDYNPAGLSTAFALRIDGGASDRNVTGLSGGADGRIITITNIGATNNLVITNQDAGSTAANRFLLPANVTMPINTALALRYDGTTSRWRPLTRALADTGVTAASYGSSSQVATFTVDTQGRLTAASNTGIAIDTSALTSGILASARFPFGLAVAINLGLAAC